VNAPVGKLELANGTAVAPTYDDPAYYVDYDGNAWRRKVVDGKDQFQRALLAGIDLEKVRRRPGLGAWGHYGDEPLIWLDYPVCAFHRVPGHPMVRKPD